MIGIDANVLIRFLTQDDPVHSPIATRLFHRFTETEPGYISLIALAEAVWVMKRTLRVPTEEIADAIEMLLRTKSVLVQSSNQVYYAMVSMREGTGSFADALIAELGEWAGCEFTYTFDVKASRLQAFRQL